MGLQYRHEVVMWGGLGQAFPREQEASLPLQESQLRLVELQQFVGLGKGSACMSKKIGHLQDLFVDGGQLLSPFLPT